jgi:hypothetical protein
MVDLTQLTERFFESTEIKYAQNTSAIPKDFRSRIAELAQNGRTLHLQV